MIDKTKKLLGLMEEAKKLAVEIQTENKTQNLDVHYLGEAINVTKMRIAYLEKNKPAVTPKSPKSSAAELKKQQEEQQRLAAEAQAKADEEELAKMEAEEKAAAEKENSQEQTQ